MRGAGINRRRKRFNPRPRVGGDVARSALLDRCATVFQSTPPRGGRPACDGYSRGCSARVFQSTPPRGGRRCVVSSYTCVAVSFNPRPRVGGDAAGVSSGTGPGTRFNPRPRVGGDRPTAAIRRPIAHVSIHAPAWGATPVASPTMHRAREFQSTPPRGGRPTAVGDDCCDQIAFQSTPPRGGRHGSGVSDRLRWPRFQSTPPRGGRPSWTDCVMRGCFNPRPRAGGDRRT